MHVIGEAVAVGGVMHVVILGVEAHHRVIADDVEGVGQVDEERHDGVRGSLAFLS